MALLTRQEAFFYQYFVPQNEAYLCSNRNPALGLANGTQCLNHSLLFETSQEVRAIKTAILDSGLPFGSEVELAAPPKAVNVEILPAMDSNRPSIKRQRQLRCLRRLSLFPAGPKIVVPITKASSGSSQAGGYSDKWKTYRFRSYDNRFGTAPVSSIQTKDVFAVENGFCATLHKVQGRTVDRVVLALSKNPTKSLAFAGLFVALSRVRKRENIRILQHLEGTLKDPAPAFGYLIDLLPDKYVTQFYAGYPENEGLWQPRLAMAAAF
jgi:hypothetical protein